MVVQVGDKVLVYGAGTPWAFAKKIDPVEVGDKVDVVTLSDGTKLAMPKIELDLSEYVWVIPQWDNGFNLGDLPFGWGMMPLGAAVFTVTGVTCHTVIDNLRKWEPGELAGNVLINITAFNRTKVLGKSNQSVIASNDESTYALLTENDPPAPQNVHFSEGKSFWALADEGKPAVIEFADSCFYVQYTGTYASFRKYVSQRVNINQVHRVDVAFKYRGTNTGESFGVEINYSGTRLIYWRDTFIDQTAWCFKYSPNLGLWVNVDYPNYTILTLYPAAGEDYSNVEIGIGARMRDGTDIGGVHEFFFDYMRFFDINGVEIVEPCHPHAVGDQYIIYNPTTKRLVFNDATKMLASANWQTGGTGAEIASSPVEYVWDGQGFVYLTSSKTTFSTILFDDLLQVQAVHGETVRTIPFHLGERIAVSGETVSRELTNITSILRAGKNTITLIAKNQDGTRVGFVTSVYVKRNMTAVSL